MAALTYTLAGGLAGADRCGGVGQASATCLLMGLRCSTGNCHRDWNRKASVRLSTQISHQTHGQLAELTEKGPSMALLGPHLEISTKYKGPAQPNHPTTSKLRNETKVLWGTPQELSILKTVISRHRLSVYLTPDLSPDMV